LVARFAASRHNSRMENALVRLAPFFIVLAIVLLLESIATARVNPTARLTARRTVSSLVLLGAGIILSRLVLPIGLVGVAMWADAHQFGALNTFYLPLWAAIVVAWLVLDLAIWAQHVTMHHVPWLWRLHRVHHSDMVMDVFTAFRFHPVEIGVSLGWKALAIVALGAPTEAVILFEIGLSTAAMLNHANVSLPPKLDRALSWVFATPAFHLVHHNPDSIYTNSNYGNVLSIWDHVFGLRRKAPMGPVAIGINDVPSDDRATALLVQPFH
jgi:sterol desaturase/sphingolipid hydroxylase (fatty acid hydroxylase superfamily)